MDSFVVLLMVIILVLQAAKIKVLKGEAEQLTARLAISESSFKVVKFAHSKLRAQLDEVATQNLVGEVTIDDGRRWGLLYPGNGLPAGAKLYTKLGQQEQETT